MKNLYFKLVLMALGLLILISCPVTPVQEEFMVRYDKNGAEGDSPPAEKYLPGARFKVAPNSGLTKEAHYFSGWNTRPDGSGESYVAGGTYTMGDGDLDLHAQWEKGTTANFWAQSIESLEWYRVTAVKLAEGDHCIVYADQAERIDKPLAEQIMTEYEEKIYPRLVKVFGLPPDIDGN
jgi:hypothetical protein